LLVAGIAELGEEYNPPSMTDADSMIHITQCKLEQFIRQDRSRICKAKERMIGEDSP
jgi:hypothetical protein